MNIQYNVMDNGIHLIRLSVRLAIVDTEEIETKFAAFCSGNKNRVIVDLSEVDF